MSTSNESVRVEPSGRVIIVGDIDVVSAPTIESALREAEERLDDPAAPVVIDVGAVRFIDSSGLRILLAASRRNERAGRRVALHSPTTALERLLGITGTTSMFDFGAGPVST
jgi:anti-anti-sigma factor